MSDDHSYGYLIHSETEVERVTVRYTPPGRWHVFYMGKWRAVYIQVKSTHIFYSGKKIIVEIDGV